MPYQLYLETNLSLVEIPHQLLVRSICCPHPKNVWFLITFTFADCTMFGHLVQFVYIPMDIPQKAYIQENCPNLAKFVDRMKDLLWPDWEEMTKGSCMEGKNIDL